MSSKIKRAVKDVLLNLVGSIPVATPQSVSPLQVYSGYDEKDFEVIRKFSKSKASVNINHYVDGFGVKTLNECVPFVKSGDLNVERLEFPVPDDGFHAEALEYVALTDALNRPHVGDAFCVVEIGAGWGPWMRRSTAIYPILPGIRRARGTTRPWWPRPSPPQ